MKIDLNAYGTEFGYWIEAFEPFVDQGSYASLKRLKEELEDSRDNRRELFDWKLSKPVTTIVTNRYDSKNKTPHELMIRWQFDAKIALLDKTRRRPLWNIKAMSTHVHVCTADDDTEVLHFHHDLRNENQIGPHLHMQVSEDFMKKKGKIPLAVPRFPFPVVLPTDCLDFALCEFFPFSWPEAQSRAIGLSMLQARQRDRFIAIAKSVADSWASTRKTPVAVIQEFYKPDLQLA